MRRTIVSICAEERTSDIMSELTLWEKRKFEEIFNMSLGYVLDYTNRTFEEFVGFILNINIYDDKYSIDGESKASRLRCLWKLESNHNVAKLNRALLKEWKLKKGNEWKESEGLFEFCEDCCDRLEARGEQENQPLSVINNVSFASAKEGATKIFISYSNLDKTIAAEVKGFLDVFGFDVFLAHEDIVVSDVWRERIETELRAMHVFLPLLSVNSKKSFWFHQETGAAIVKGVKIVPLCLDDTLPAGLMDKVQCCFIVSNKESALKKVLVSILGTSKISDNVANHIYAQVCAQRSFASSAEFTPILLKIDFTKYAINKVFEGIVENLQVYHSFDSRPNIWRLIEVYEDLIEPKLLERAKELTGYEFSVLYFKKTPNYTKAFRSDRLSQGD